MACNYFSTLNNPETKHLHTNHPQRWYHHSSGWLWGIYLLIVATVILRVNVESTNYTTPDSEYYLIVAENVATGKGYVSPHPMDYPIKTGAKEYPFTIWPVGYPSAISSVIKLTGLNSLWASKTVNLIFLGFIFLILQAWLRGSAWIAGLYFLSYGKMEVFSYSWSEGGFLFLQLLLCLWIVRSLSGRADRWLWFKLTSTLICLFLFRYAGLIFFFFCAGWMVYFLIIQKHSCAAHYFGALLLSSIFVLFYFHRNYELSGFYSGMHRIQPEIESVFHFTWLLIRGLFNELMLARNYFFKGDLDPLFIGLMVLQITLMIQVFRQKHLLKLSIMQNQAIKVLSLCGLVYLIGIIILRKIQPFDPFDFRILAPYSTPLFIAFFGLVALPENKEFRQRNVSWIVIFMFICWVMNLPKQFLINQFLGLFS